MILTAGRQNQRNKKKKKNISQDTRCNIKRKRLVISLLQLLSVYSINTFKWFLMKGEVLRADTSETKCYIFSINKN